MTRESIYKRVDALMGVGKVLTYATLEVSQTKPRDTAPCFLKPAPVPACMDDSGITHMHTGVEQ